LVSHTAALDLRFVEILIAAMSMLDRKPEASAQSDFQADAINHSPRASLSALCRHVIVSNLERYPPDAFAILDEEEWEALIRKRHDKTRPQKGRGGLDGTGRRTPAVTDKFLCQVEEAIPHLAESAVVDTIVWKDCVSHRFKEGGLSRPQGLMYPWPVLVEGLQESGNNLLALIKKEDITEGDKELALQEIRALAEAPMNISLLKATGIGKTVKKFLKASAARESCLGLHQTIDLSGQTSQETPISKLQSTLNAWISMAASSGVKMKSEVDSPCAKRTKCDRDLSSAEKCQSWRQLFAMLKNSDEKRVENQGARMRERRQKLDSDRPKIVKVRPTKPHHAAILSRPGYGGGTGSAPSASGTSKLNQIKMEARVTVTRQRPPVQAKVPSGGGGFGAAVAFASTSKSTKKRKASSKIISLANGKRMKVPDTKKAASNQKSRWNKVKKQGHR
jgi:hypothetical protein